MFERERLYSDITSILGGETETETKAPPPGVYISPALGAVLSALFILLLVWVGADIYQAVHALTHR